jgi:hypothetical protein
MRHGAGYPKPQFSFDHFGDKRRSTRCAAIQTLEELDEFDGGE